MQLCAQIRNIKVAQKIENCVCFVVFQSMLNLMVLQ